MKFIKVATSIFILIFLSGSVYAQITDYYVKQSDGSDDNDGLSWDSAVATIGRAIELADGDSAELKLINVAAGTYEEHLTLSTEGVYLLGGYPADAEEGATRDYRAREYGVECTEELTILDGGDTVGSDIDDVGRPVTIDGVSSACVEGFLIQNGFSEDYGAGIRVENSTGVIISHNRIEDNDDIRPYRFYDCKGGGISFAASNGSITDNTISNNRVASGGGIYINISRGDNAQVMIRDNTISDNTARAGNGGGIMITDMYPTSDVEPHPPCYIWGNTIENNEVYGMVSFHDVGGGGIYVANSAGIKIYQNAILSNTSAQGGGIDLEEVGDVFIQENTISENETEGFYCDSGGGGIRFTNTNGRVISNIITNNVGACGDGIHIIGESHIPMIGSDPSELYMGLGGNCIYDNGEYDLYYSGDSTVYAHLNYWGTTDLPTIDSRIGGSGHVVWVARLDECHNEPIVPTPYPSGEPQDEPFMYEILVYNPFYPQGGDVEVRLDLEDWPKGWSAKLEQSKIQFSEKELARDLKLNLAYSSDADPTAVIGDCGISVWLPNANKPLEDFSVTVKVPNLTGLVSDLPLQIPYPVDKPFEREILVYNPFYPQAGTVELRSDLGNLPDGWSADLNQTEIQFGEYELSRNVKLTMECPSNAKHGDRGALDVSVWIEDMKEPLEIYSIVGEIPIEAARTLSITSSEASPGTKTTVQLSITDATGMTGGSAFVKYDPDVITVGEVKGTDLISDMVLVVNKNVQGEIKLSMAGAEGIPSGSGGLVDIELIVNENAETEAETTLEFGDTEIYNESGTVIPVNLEDGIVEIAQPCVKGDLNKDGRIRANDAIFVLQIAAWLKEPTEYQKCAGDMNDDGEIKANDAILILREAAGLAAPVIQSVANVSGTIAVMLGETHGVVGDSVTVPLKVDNIHELAGGDICITYDRAVLRAVDVSSDSDLLLASNIIEPGTVQMAFAGTDRLSSQTVVEMEFEVLADDISPLTLQSVELYRSDAQLIDSKNTDGQFSSWAIAPEHNALLQNFPNPFNPETWIPYDLAVNATVSIEIYNIEGQLVRRLNIGDQKAGSYLTKGKAAYWDGKNERGEKVANGIYFYTLQAEKFKATRRMLIVK